MSLEMLDTVCREFTLSILRKIVNKFKEEGSQKTVSEVLNELDEHGYALIHYFCYVNYEQAIQFLIQEEADLNMAAKTEKAETPLTIATHSGHQEIV